MEDIPESEEKKIPKFLYVAYIVVFAWGIWAFIMYWNGSHGWLDRGYWQKLQQAADTTFPFEQKEPYLSEERVQSLGKKGV